MLSDPPTGLLAWRVRLARRLFAVAVRCIHWAVALVRGVPA